MGMSTIDRVFFEISLVGTGFFPLPFDLSVCAAMIAWRAIYLTQTTIA
jgi:hypothetical protein